MGNGKFYKVAVLWQMEVVLPAIMTVQESHDIALVLQHKVESFDEVERAFVHGTLRSSLLFLV